MSIVVSVKSAARTVATRVNTFTSGAADTIAVDLPVDTSSGFAVPAAQKPVTAAKLWVGTIALGASTPVTLDLTALVGGQGDTSFANVTLLSVYNLETAASGRLCTIGGDGTAGEWWDPFGVAGSKLQVPANRERLLDHSSPTGWAVGTRKLVKFDPGAGPCSVTVTVGGN